MNIMFRRSSKLLSLLFILTLLASCSSGTTSTEIQQPSEQRIMYLSVNKEDEGSTRMISELSKEYQQQQSPQTVFQFDNVAESSLNQRVELLAASNDLPELFSYQSGKPLIDLIQSDAVLDLEAVFTELGLMDKLLPAAVELLKANVDEAGLYALPLEFNIEGFWYNKQLFEQYGLEIPQTWDELIEIADLLYRQGIQPFSVAGKDKWPITRLINAYAIRMYGADVMERVDRGEISLTDEGFIEAVNTVQQMGLNGYLGKRVNTVDMESSVNAFLNGEAAMFYMGSWQLRAFNDKSRNHIGEEAIGFFSIPLVEGGVGTLDEYPVNAGLTTSFSKEAYTPEVGKWMGYVFEHYGDRAMSELGMITGFQVEKMPENIPPLTKVVQEKINEVSKGALWFEARFSSSAQLLAWDNAQLLMTDANYTPVQYLSALQQELNRTN